ncbi:hypothetical protein E5288_WYG009336 [Bos mutus]|uniref:Uncharacterized protein n=1 Tax=Bos mutus TaxID=72004 RepID=A0A6B0S3S7_9CETA|nr:hypothetical protein [Bos mutus]
MSEERSSETTCARTLNKPTAHPEMFQQTYKTPPPSCPVSGPKVHHRTTYNLELEGAPMMNMGLNEKNVQSPMECDANLLSLLCFSIRGRTVVTLLGLSQGQRILPADRGYHLLLLPESQVKVGNNAFMCKLTVDPSDTTSLSFNSLIGMGTCCSAFLKFTENQCALATGHGSVSGSFCLLEVQRDNKSGREALDVAGEGHLQDAIRMKGPPHA